MLGAGWKPTGTEEHLVLTDVTPERMWLTFSVSLKGQEGINIAITINRVDKPDR